MAVTGQRRGETAAGPHRGPLARLLAVVRTVIGFPLFAVVTLLSALGVIAVSAVRRDAGAIQWIARSWSRCFLLLGPIRLRIEGRDRLDPGGQYVFTANHQSNFDIPVMFLAAPTTIRFLAKKEVYKIPVLAQAMRAMGMVEVDRGAGSRVHALLNERVAETTARGHSLLIFPEGTRSHDGRLGEFRKGGFRIAIASKLPVVPVTIDGTGAAWGPGAKLRYPGRVTVTFHEPIPTTELPLTAITPLRNQVQEAVVAGLG